MRLILVACRMRRLPFLAASMRVSRLLSMLLLFAVAGVAYANPQAQTLWRLLDYIAVDYPAAIGEDGKVVSQLEYDEMTEFSATVREGLARLPAHPSGPAPDAKAGARQDAIAAKAPPAEVKQIGRASCRERGGRYGY